MPRLTNPDYLAQRRNLIDYWEDEHVAWAHLLPQEQWHLHDFYQPSKYLTDEQALAHRAEISKQRPSLPQQAGKAYKAIMSFEPFVRADLPSLDYIAKKPKKRKRSKDYVVRVKALARPDVDFDKLARVLLDIARDQAEKKNET